MAVEPGTRFTALVNFSSWELHDSQYLEGMSYTVREGDRDLARLVPEWVTEGKVIVDDPHGAPRPGKLDFVSWAVAIIARARVSGAGKTT